MSSLYELRIRSNSTGQASFTSALLISGGWPMRTRSIKREVELTLGGHHRRAVGSRQTGSRQTAGGRARLSKSPQGTAPGTTWSDS